MSRILSRPTQTTGEPVDPSTLDGTPELLVAQLIDTVRRIDPSTALRVLVPTIYPRAQFKAVNVEVDFDDLEGTLQCIATKMASGGDMASLGALFSTVKAVQEARALAQEMRLSELELNR